MALSVYHEDANSLAYDEGYRAFEEYESLNDCPYPDTGESDSLYSYWVDGFSAAYRKLTFIKRNGFNNIT